MELFTEIEKNIKSKSESLSELNRELKFYSQFKSMRDAGISLDNIKEMLDTDIKNFEAREVCLSFLSATPQVVSEVLKSDSKEADKIVCFLNNEKQSFTSFIKSREDCDLARKAFSFLTSDKSICYNSTIKQIDEYKETLEAGVSFDDLREMVKTDINLFYDNIDWGIDSIEEDEFDIDFEEKCLSTFSKTNNNQTATKNEIDARKKILSLCLVEKEMKRKRHN